MRFTDLHSQREHFHAAVYWLPQIAEIYFADCAGKPITQNPFLKSN